MKSTKDCCRPDGQPCTLRNSRPLALPRRRAAIPLLGIFAFRASSSSSPLLLLLLFTAPRTTRRRAKNCRWECRPTVPTEQVTPPPPPSFLPLARLSSRNEFYPFIPFPIRCPFRHCSAAKNPFLARHAAAAADDSKAWEGKIELCARPRARAGAQAGNGGGPFRRRVSLQPAGIPEPDLGSETLRRKTPSPDPRGRHEAV